MQRPYRRLHLEPNNMHEGFLGGRQSQRLPAVDNTICCQQRCTAYPSDIDDNTARYSSWYPRRCPIVKYYAIGRTRQRRAAVRMIVQNVISDFQYVVKKKIPPRICFGSGLEREVMPLKGPQLSPFMRSQTPFYTPEVGPGTYETKRDAFYRTKTQVVSFSTETRTRSISGSLLMTSPIDIKDERIRRASTPPQPRANVVFILKIKRGLDRDQDWHQKMKSRLNTKAKVISELWLIE
ncbi:hypothetical protein EVAR_76447_1 [Eumeta japonica]|uniref:Uncharacterized protein n=1 Tax=Eumeta variegata TaxID=151549 RepID=A0A4C1T925_EUMVA|nr:hypothetical protein EVAR_76447_1 [Eumeta japonica]